VQTKTCLKCGKAAAYEGQPPEACPQCGAIYAKVEALRLQADLAALRTAATGQLLPAEKAAPKRRRLGAALAVVVGVCVGAYWYLSPYYAMFMLQRAAEARDAEAVNQRVDYQALRESLKGQFAARMGPASTANMPGVALVNQMIDFLVRPEALMDAMRTGGLPSPTALGSRRAAPDRRPQWRFERSGVDSVTAYPLDPKNPTPERVFGLVFQRQGFAAWRLSGIRLPPEK
jgi:hypothetical protein